MDESIVVHGAEEAADLNKTYLQRKEIKFVIVAYDWMQKIYDSLLAIDFKIVICDEAHMIKNGLVWHFRNLTFSNIRIVYFCVFKTVNI